MLRFGFSQRELAKKSGVSHATINRFLNNKGNLTDKNLSAIANVFKITISELKGETMPIPKTVEELHHLEWEDIDLAHGIIKIQSKKGWHPKTYELRSIPISSRLKETIKALARPDGARFVFDDGFGNHSFTQGWAYKVLQNILRSNNIPPANLYTFRHTFGSQLAASGCDVATIKELMGHSAITTTEQYLHTGQKQKKSAVEAL